MAHIKWEDTTITVATTDAPLSRRALSDGRLTEDEHGRVQNRPHEHTQNPGHEMGSRTLWRSAVCKNLYNIVEARQFKYKFTKTLGYVPPN